MLLLDGGSTSIRRFLPSPLPVTSPNLSSLWTSAYSLTSPDSVQAWHTSFLKAGSNIITTNTYQIPLTRENPELDIRTLMHSAVTLAVNAVRNCRNGSIALSLGTRNAGYGKGDYDTEAKVSILEYAIFHRDRLNEYYSVLGDMWEGIEYLAFETISSYEEAEAILEVLSDKSVSELILNKKAWITFSCGDASITRMESIFSRLLTLPTLSNLWGIGFNCVGIDIAPELATMLGEKISSTALTLVLYPDAGRWCDKTTAQFTYHAPASSDEEVQKWAGALVEMSRFNNGKVVLGGCCNTDYRFIAALASLLSI